jgi:hypothetical protein
LLTRIVTTEKRLVVHADEKLTAFVELESAVRAFGREIKSVYRDGQRLASSLG